MKHILSIVAILTQCFVFGQIIDNFTDGDVTNNPSWGGTPSHFIVNGSGQAQLNNTQADTSYLSTAHGLSTLDGKEWRMWTRQSFAPSGGNYAKIFLTASAADLTTLPDGFYLQLGEAGSSDAVHLIKRSGGADVTLISGVAGQIASSFSIGIRVVRSVTGDWTLSIDPAGGQNYVLAGTANDPTALLGSHFGMLNVYTVSNSTGFYYDDIYVGDEIIDTAPPTITSATAINSTQVDVLFDEALDPITSQNASNYTLLPSIGISSVVQDVGNAALMHITMSSPLTNGQTYQLTVNGVEDINGNAISNGQIDFTYLIADVPQAGDVIINEFMCDPDPQVGLPPVEFVEIHNVSSKIFNVSGWKLKDAASAGTLQQGWLLPGDHLVLTATANVDSFVVATAVTSFPSLNNTGDNIVLVSDLGVQLDSITYTDDWYHDISKTNGGWTIERINPNLPCSSIDNWTASTNSNGGTPGSVNSVFNNTPDTQIPQLMELIALAPNFLEVHFNEGMDSSALSTAVITTNPALTEQNRYILEAYPSMMTLQFVENFVTSQLYSIQLNGVADCSQNITSLIGTFTLPDNPLPGDIVINEILFNPITGGYDWVEVYNRSNKVLNMKDWQFANFDNDTVANFKSISDQVLLYPDSYMVFAEDTAEAKMSFPTHQIGRFYQMDLPTYSNDSGTVYLITVNTMIDKVSYFEDWHFQFLDDFDGKSLERMDPDGLSNDKNNWHTAAEAIGFGTPGLRNSQYYPPIDNGDFSYTSETISPDNDGFEDVLQINYNMTEPGLIGDFTIYDDRGREVIKLLESELLGSSGTFTWDGTLENKMKASIGAYIGVFEVFKLDGSVAFAKRKVFVVAGKL